MGKDFVMVSVLSEPLSGVLHELLTARSLRERNKELALALVAAADRGEANQLTRHWARPDHAGRPALPGGLRLRAESVLADGDAVVLRATARAGRAVWSLVAELGFDAAGHLARYQDLLVARPDAD
jgi:hypothetical protein